MVFYEPCLLKALPSCQRSRGAQRGPCKIVNELNEKRALLVVCWDFFWDEIPTQLGGDYIINHEIRICLLLVQWKLANYLER